MNTNFLLNYEDSLDIFAKEDERIVGETVEKFVEFENIVGNKYESLIEISKNSLYLLGDADRIIQKEINNLWKRMIEENDVSDRILESLTKNTLDIGFIVRLSPNSKYCKQLVIQQLKFFKSQSPKNLELFIYLDESIDKLNNKDMRKEINDSIDMSVDVKIHLLSLMKNQKFSEVYKIIEKLDISQSIDYFQYFIDTKNKELTERCLIELKDLLMDLYKITDEKCEIELFENEFEEWRDFGYEIDTEEQLTEVSYLEELSNMFILDEHEIDRFIDFMITEGIEKSHKYQEMLLKNGSIIEEFEDENFHFQMYIDNQILEKKIELFVDLFLILRQLNEQEFESNVNKIQNEILDQMKKDDKIYIGKVCGYLKNLTGLKEYLVLEKSFLENICPIFESIINSNLAEIGIFQT
eukprot:gene2138-2004_t